MEDLEQNLKASLIDEKEKLGNSIATMAEQENIEEINASPIQEEQREEHERNSPLSPEEPFIYNLPDVKGVTKKVMFKLLTVSVVCMILMVAELVGGVLAGSLAIMTDAAHLFSDLSGFFISIFSLWLTNKPSTKKLTYGYHRAEVIGAMASIVLIWGLTIWLIAEAIQRILYQNFVIEKYFMLGTAIFGLLCNLLMGKILHGHSHHHHGHDEHGHDHGHGHSHDHGHKHDHDHKHKEHDHEEKHAHNEKKQNKEKKSKIEEKINENNHSHDKEKNKKNKKKQSKNLSHVHEHENYNLRAAMIHIIGDTIQSIGVVIAALIIFFNEDMKLADPICTFIFAILVIFTTIPVVKDCMRVLMEGVPVGIAVNEFEEKLWKIEGVKEIHDLHIWSLSVGKPALSAHIFSINSSKTLKKATKLCRKYGIYHSTLQIENWHEKNDKDFIKCEHNLHD